MHIRCREDPTQIIALSTADGICLCEKGKCDLRPEPIKEALSPTDAAQKLRNLARSSIIQDMGEDESLHNAADTLDRLQAQLPVEMQECTILIEQIPKEELISSQLATKRRVAIAILTAMADTHTDFCDIDMRLEAIPGHSRQYVLDLIDGATNALDPFAAICFALGGEPDFNLKPRKE